MVGCSNPVCKHGYFSTWTVWDSGNNQTRMKTSNVCGLTLFQVHRYQNATELTLTYTGCHCDFLLLQYYSVHSIVLVENKHLQYIFHEHTIVLHII